MQMRCGLTGLLIQWNLNYLNPRFFETPDSSSQKLSPLDLLQSDFYPKFCNSRFFEPNSVSLGGWKIGITLNMLYCNQD